MDISTLLTRHRGLRAALDTVARHGPPGAWIGAGAVRNVVWDALHCRSNDLAAADVDVVFLDATRPDAALDRASAERLAAVHPGLAWSVTNQARMHARHGHPAYPDLPTAIAHWPETATAVAASYRQHRFLLLAPHGLADLRHGLIRPSPAYRARPDVVAKRLETKGWLRRWPRLVTRLA